jgi:hypothetical protein
LQRQIQSAFPGAMTYSSLVRRLSRIISPDPNKILLATSFCCDEVNRKLEWDLEAVCKFYSLFENVWICYRM